MTRQMHPLVPSYEFVSQLEPAVAAMASTTSYVPEAAPVPDVDL